MNYVPQSDNLRLVGHIPKYNYIVVIFWEYARKLKNKGDFMKKLNCIIAILISIFLLTSCVPKPAGGDDVVPEGKEPIYVEIYEGGFGVEWVNQAAKDFNALEENGDYHIVIKVVQSVNTLDLKMNIEAGVSASDAYFTAEPNIKAVINADLLVDISEFIDTKVPGENITIREKLRNPEDVLTTFSKQNEGLYALPYGDGFAGFVFDYGLFEEKGWLIYNMVGGEEVLSPGPDKIAGTYDDGQPSNMEEWQAMIDIISSKPNSYPFIYNTKYPNYLTNIVDAIIAQYSGLDGHKTFTSYNGDFKDANGDTVTVTPETGYKAYDIPGVQKGIEFLDTYLTNNQRYVHTKSWGSTEFSHRDAQNAFVLGYRQNIQAPLGALLFEGSWWENEARPIFDSLVSNGYPQRGYGMRDYRFMMFPAMEGQQGIDGAGHGTVFNCMDAGSFFAVKNESEPAKQQKVLDFMAWTCRDEYLQLFTTISGAVRPYNYELTEQQYNGLTPFQKNVWQIYNDTDNVSMVRTNFDSNASPFFYASTKPSRYYSYIENAGYDPVYRAATRFNAATILESMKSYNQSNWSKFYNEVIDLL